ncbi:MAG TPA: hypothetical protein VH144_02575 [Candidatus Saccharimonadales bacterium]|jgi:hypothetical protein|nr:hypothetical protein [Candidatus Saccharimonadales bacterium]
MKDELRKKLLARQMTRQEFLQFMGASILVVFGLSNLMSFLKNIAEPAPKAKPKEEVAHGFGSRKFGA